MVYFVGAGPGAPDLLTIRGAELLKTANRIIYAGSLVNPALLDMRKEGCDIFNSAEMTLEEVIARIQETEKKGGMTVRLHTGDPSLYSAMREQMDILDEKGISYEVCPGVSAFSGAAAALDLVYTLPGISQTVIITRAEGRTPVPERENLRALAAHRSTIVLFLSAGMTGKVSEELIAGGYSKDTPAAIVYKASWPEEKYALCTVETLEETAKKEGLTKTAIIIVGDAVAQKGYLRSKLYDPSFTTEYRIGNRKGTGG